MPLVHPHLHFHLESWIEQTGFTENADTSKLEAFSERVIAEVTLARGTQKIP